MKNGKSEGTTDVAHKVKPFFTAVKLFLENKSKHIAKIIKMIANKFLLILITKIWHFENIKSPYKFICSYISFNT